MMRSIAYKESCLPTHTHTHIVGKTPCKQRTIDMANQRAVTHAHNTHSHKHTHTHTQTNTNTHAHTNTHTHTAGKALRMQRSTWPTSVQ